ncbi:MAG: response regulator [Anaerolineales bacterium]|nr:response regulator [Anaerolineales bacterium]
MDHKLILLADDHAVVRAGIRKIVEETPGLKVVDEAENGPQVFEALAEGCYDILLIDLTMPDFEPISGIRQIRADHPDMKILVVSAYDDDVYVRGLMGAGVDGYHLKDQPLSDLKLAVERILAGERWVSSPLLNKLVRHSQAIAATPELTHRQHELLRLLQQGLDNRAIAQQMDLSVKTIENHLTRLYRLLGVQSRLEAVNHAIRYPEILGVSGQSAAGAPAERPLVEQKCISILVVDDNARYRQQLQHMIGKICPQAVIYEAHNTATALHLAQRLSPQLAFVDVVLGEEDGIRCTRRIKSVSPQSRVVLISAYPDREFHRLGLQAGAVAFLDKKDLDAKTLRQVIEDVIP